MITGRPKPTLILTNEERSQLRSVAHSRTLPHALVARAQLVLWSAEGESNTRIASRLRWTKATVGKWRQRFVQQRLAGLYDELRPGRQRTIGEERIASLLKRTLSRKPRVEHTGVSGKRPRPAAFPNRPCTGCFRHLPCSRIVRAVSNSPRSVLHREGAGHRRPVSEPARPCPGAL